MRSALSGARAQISRLPTWATVTLAIALVAVLGEVAYLVLQSGGDGGGPRAAEAGPACDAEAVDDAVEGGRFEQDVRDLGTVPPLAELLEIYDAKLVGCGDLTGDGAEEMVVRLLERGVAPVDGGVPAGTMHDSPTPWAIYMGEDDEWVPAATRTHVATLEVSIDGDQVRERTPALVEGDPLCCPSGERGGVVRWTGTGFTYRAEGAPSGSTIAFADEAPVALAGLDLDSASLPSAIALFGPPTTYAPVSDLCPSEWSDLGLTIEFANLAGADPCGPEGRVGTVRVEGPEALLAGWKTQDGAALGISQRELRKLYPEMTPSEQTTFIPGEPTGQPYTLVDPSLTARIHRDAVIGFEVTVTPLAP